MLIKRFVQYNDIGRRCGETHHLAKFSDQMVEKIRCLHEDDHWSYSRIATLYRISKSAVAMICQYRRRADMVVTWRVLKPRVKG
jgi:hypothetical protein